MLYGFKTLNYIFFYGFNFNRERATKKNAGLIILMLDNANVNFEVRLSDDCAQCDELRTITLEDLEAGLRASIRCMDVWDQQVQLS